ncbi:MAG: flagellar hook assembly protein FlgD [Desulfobacterales bacterium]|nr:flagellar hook assembly protein FlgD [Desulfobacterales bacterium]
MSIDSISSYFSYLNTATDTSSSETDSDTSLGQEDFLTLMVAQLQNQDPLNPMDGTEYTAQLAQFSALEQQMETNTLLSEISSKLDTDSTENILDYIGKDVTYSGYAMTIDGGTATSASFSIEDSANINVTIYNTSGEEVKNLYLGQNYAGTYGIEWDGTDSSGSQVDDGVYYYSISAINESGGAVNVETTMSGTVTGLSYENGNQYLVVNDNLINPASIIEITIPEESEEV